MKLNSTLSKIVFVFLITIIGTYSFNIFSGSIILSKYGYNELFINYEVGFIRRGFIGQLFIFLDNYLDIEPKLFFTFLFFILYVFQVILFFKVFTIKYIEFHSI